MDEDIIVKDQDKIVDNDNPDKNQVIVPDKSVPDNDKGGMVKIGDKEYSVSDVESWQKDSENKSNWQKELTQKSQRVSDESKELERFRAMRDFIDNPDNKDKADKIDKIVKDELKELPPENEFESEETKALREKLNTLESQVKNIQDDGYKRNLVNIQREIDTEKKQIKTDFPDLADEELDMIEAMTIKEQTQSEEIIKLSEVAKKYIDFSNKKKEGIIKSYLDGKEEDAEKFTENGSIPPPPKERKVSLDDGTAQKEFAKTIAGLTKD